MVSASRQPSSSDGIVASAANSVISAPIKLGAAVGCAVVSAHDSVLSAAVQVISAAVQVDSGVVQVNSLVVQVDSVVVQVNSVVVQVVSVVVQVLSAEGKVGYTRCQVVSAARRAPSFSRPTMPPRPRRHPLVLPAEPGWLRRPGRGRRDVEPRSDVQDQLTRTSSFRQKNELAAERSAASFFLGRPVGRYLRADEEPKLNANAIWNDVFAPSRPTGMDTDGWSVSVRFNTKPAPTFTSP